MMPPLPESFTILSRRKSGTEEVVSRASAIEYGAACAAAERERCASICDQLAVMSLDPMVCRGSAEECAAAIRARGNT